MAIEAAFRASAVCVCRYTNDCFTCGRCHSYPLQCDCNLSGLLRFIIRALRRSEVSVNFKTHRPFLGNATYSSYLMHFPIQLGLVGRILDALGFSRTVFFSPIVLVAYLALVISTSLAVYHLFELPAQNWIRRRARRPKSMPQATL